MESNCFVFSQVFNTAGISDLASILGRIFAELRLHSTTNSRAFQIRNGDDDDQSDGNSVSVD